MRGSRNKRNRVAKSRPRLHKISEEMKAWSAALAEEVSTWPQISTRPMFGLVAVYRRGKIFAALPRTRTMDPADSIAFKVPKEITKLQARAKRDPRVHFSDHSFWATLEMHSNDDIRAGLEWLSRAYEAAR